MHKFLILLLLAALPAAATEKARIAVASNFLDTASILVQSFEAATGHQVELASGSSGNLFGQIINGAPFDAFLSADAARPRQLQIDGFVVASTRFTYAKGSLVLLAAPGKVLESDLRLSLLSDEVRYLAIANPRLAPYGVAARQTLEALGILQELEQRIVQGESIGKVFGLVITGNASVGFVASSQLIARPDNYDYIDIPPSLHAPIHQQAVLLKSGQHNAAAVAFLEYLQTAEARSIIRMQGYGVTDSD